MEDGTLKKQIIQRYGKPASGIYSLKQKFFCENERLLEESEQFRSVYTRQPIRKTCKICGHILGEKVYFISHGTPFYMCELCGHINGRYEDGKKYTEDLYASGMYGSAYYEENMSKYVHRVESIYIPKVQFLLDVLESEQQNYEEFHYLDVGTGAGYMVGAYNRLGLIANGFDINRNEIEYGNKMLGAKALSVIQPDHVAKEISGTNCQVISFIGVLEHVVNLQEVLSALKNNLSIKYIYFSVPKFSLSCILEIVFPEVFPRLIGGGGGHTHLFTDESIEWICNTYHFDLIAKWQFGTDIMDLYRSLSVMLQKESASDELLANISKLFLEQTDALQLVVDKTNLASEVHVVLKNM